MDSAEAAAILTGCMDSSRFPDAASPAAVSASLAPGAAPAPQGGLPSAGGGQEAGAAGWVAVSGAAGAQPTPIAQAGQISDANSAPIGLAMRGVAGNPQMAMGTPQAMTAAQPMDAQMMGMRVMLPHAAGLSHLMPTQQLGMPQAMPQTGFPGMAMQGMGGFGGMGGMAMLPPGMQMPMMGMPGGMMAPGGMCCVPPNGMGMAPMYTSPMMGDGQMGIQMAMLGGMGMAPGGFWCLPGDCHERPRTHAACVMCHERKLRCVMLPDGNCTNCLAKSHKCERRVERRRGRPRTATPDSMQTLATGGVRAGEGTSAAAPAAGSPTPFTVPPVAPADANAGRLPGAPSAELPAATPAGAAKGPAAEGAAVAPTLLSLDEKPAAEKPAAKKPAADKAAFFEPVPPLEPPIGADALGGKEQPAAAQLELAAATMPHSLEA